MRAAREGSFIFQTKHDKLIGINLGADYCSEHEWGIDGIKRDLGITKVGFGLENRQATKEPAFLLWFEKTIGEKKHAKKYVGFAMYRFYEGVEKWSPRDGMYGQSEFYAGWAKDGFYVMADASNTKAIENLKEINDALKAKNACVWLGGGGVFQNAGLCIGIVDKMPKEIFEGWAKADYDHFELTEKFNDTGIEKLLRAAGKEWFALSPSMHGKELKVWLNPRHQNVNNFGWFTIAELKLWAQDKGPIPMTDAQKREHGRRY